MKEDLRKWFGKGKKGDWVRVGTDGEIKGDCARDQGEGKPKCMPRSKAHSMSKKDRASAARRKRRADPNPDRPGTGNKPIMVKTDKKEMNEKNVPTNPKLWAKFKAQAKAKFDVYPSAYANGWAAKQYKAAGGGWKTESVNEMKSFKYLREKSVSQSQQKMMGMALAYKRGEMPDASPEVKKMANSMSMKDLEDFAKTKHKGLPVKKEEVELGENNLRNKQLFMQPFISNFYGGKYYERGIDSMFVLASSPKEASKIAEKHIDAALEHFKNKRYRKGSKTIPALKKDERYIEVGRGAKPTTQQKHPKVLTADGVVKPVDLAELGENNLRKMDHDTFMKYGDENPKGRADAAWNAERKRRYKNAQQKNYRKMNKESVELGEAMGDDDWVVVKGRKVVRTLKNPKNNKAPRNWQKSSDETEVIRVSKAKQMGIIKEEVELDEAFTPKEIKMAIGVASDKRYAKGNMTGAVNAIEKIKKGLSDHPQVKAVLRRQNESLDEAGSPERLAIIKRAAQRVKDKKDAADKKAFSAAKRDMRSKGAQRGMAPLKRDLDEGRNDARKALMSLAKQGGIDKATFQKAYDLYSDTKFVELKKLIAGADTDPREAILDVINRHDRKTFNSMYPRGLSKGGLTKESTELGEMNLSKQTSKQLLQFYRKYADKKMGPSDANTVRAVRRELMKRGVSIREEAELGEATDFRKGDKVHQVGSKLKGTVMHKGNRDEIVVKFGTITKTIPSSQLRLVESVELDEIGMGMIGALRKKSRKKAIKGITPKRKKSDGDKKWTKKDHDYLKKNTSKQEPEWDGNWKEEAELDEANIFKKLVTGGKLLKPLSNALTMANKGELEYTKNNIENAVKILSKTSDKSENKIRKEMYTIIANKTKNKQIGQILMKMAAAIEEEVDLDEATYMVTIDKGTFGGVKSDGRPILVKAKSVRDATTKAAKKVKIDPRLVPTGGFDVKVNNKESVEHENCGTPDCCGTCDTDIKEMNFFQFRNRINEARRDAAKDLYFDTYSAAIQKAINTTFDKNKLEVDAEDYYQKVNMGPGKPGRGKTTRHTIDLVDVKTGKPSRKKLHIQIYNRETAKNPYELNYYVS